MAKLKTKRCVMDTEATENEPDRWEFATGKLRWQWVNRMGINLYVAFGDEGFQGVLYAKNLDHAVMFAHGFEAGISYSERTK